jgi:hypothetical protein
VAIGLETRDWFPEASSIKHLIYDFVRPFVGLNLLIENLGVGEMKYSNMFYNERMWTHVDRRSQIMPMVAQSNLYFGFMGTPILTIGFVAVALWISNILERISSIELWFLGTFCVARLGILMGQNSMNVVNELSFSLILPASLVIVCGRAKAGAKAGIAQNVAYRSRRLLRRCRF